MAYFHGLFRARKFARLYIGGGTPNLLEAEQLVRLSEAIQSRFDFADGVIRCIEFAPEVTTREKLTAVVGCGFNRVSFGVQSLNERALCAVNRPTMTLARAQEAVEAAHGAGVDVINVDLIYGLPEESDESFKAGVIQLLATRPGSVVIALLSNSVVSHVYGSSDDQARKEVAFWHLYQWLKDHLPSVAPDYEVTPSPVPRYLILWRSELLARRGHALYRFMAVERDRFPEIGFGQYAQTRIPGVLRCQNVRTSNSFDPEADDCCAAREYTPELEVAFDIATALTYRGSASVSDIESHFGTIPDQVRIFLDDLVACGDLVIRGDTFVRGAAKENPLGKLLREMIRRPRTRLTTDRIDIALVKEGSEYLVCIEPVAPGQKYFFVVDGIGVHYSCVKEPATEEMRRFILAEIRRLEVIFEAAGVSASDLGKAGHLARSHFQSAFSLAAPTLEFDSDPEAEPAFGAREQRSRRRAPVSKSVSEP